jgi:hypothetical protein
VVEKAESAVLWIMPATLIFMQILLSAVMVAGEGAVVHSGAVVELVDGVW